MGAPCINDTCSITSKIDPVTRRLEHSVVLNAVGGLSCENGLKAEILGDPAPTAPVDTAFQQLGMSPAGELWAIPHRARFESFGSASSVPIPANGDASASPITEAAIVNPFPSAALVVVAWRMRVGYTISEVPGLLRDPDLAGAPNWIPYSAMIRAGLTIEGSQRATAFFDLSGVHPSTSAPHHRRRWEEGVWAGVIGAGATWIVSANARYQVGAANEVQKHNVDTSAPDGNMDDRGFSANGQAIIMPFGGQ